MSASRSSESRPSDASISDASGPSRETTLASFSKVFEAELQKIVERRSKNPHSSGRNEPKEAVRRSLVGLCFSGGGIRAACIAMGFVAALRKHQLFQIFDYLSTVSGGGYLGGYLTSWFARYPREAVEGQFPLPADALNAPEGKGVRNLIQGGDYIIDGPTAFNKYLIGLLLNKAAIISLMLFVSAFVALLWRSLDTYAARETLHLFDLDSDFLVPFLPAAFFAFAWIVGWVLSYFRSGNSATGRLPGVMLMLATGAFLIALALLFGNGDVRLPWSSDEDEPSAIPQQYWAPFVFLIVLLTALVPIIRPQRLLQSAVAPRNVLDKWTFRAFSTAILAGLPLILIGLIGREDFSGYFRFPERGFHEADFRFPVLAPEILLSSVPEVDDPNFDLLDYLKTHGLPLSPSLDSSTREDESLGPESDASNRTAGFVLLQAQLAAQWPLGLPLLPFFELSSAVDPGAFLQAEVFEPSRNRDVSPTTLTFYWSESGGAEPHSDLSTERKPVVDGLRDTDAALDYLRFLAIRIVVAAREEHAARSRFVRLNSHTSEQALLQPGPQRWQWFSMDDYVVQCCRAGLYLICNGSSEAREYVQARTAHRNLREQVANYLNLTLLTSRDFSERLAVSARSRLDRADKLKLDTRETARLRETILQAERAIAGWGNRFQIASLNRDLLEVNFPDLLIPRDRVQRRVVIGSDQHARLLFALAALFATLTIGWYLDINLSSMHRYYRTRLGLAFIVPSRGSELPALHSLDTTSVGAPYHLFGTCVSRFGESRSAQLRRPTLASVEGPNAVGTGSWDSRKQDIFLMSPLFVGSEATGGYIDTESYQLLTQNRCEQLDLGNVIALSGAAVSPALNGNPLLALLMFTLNLRLGQWMPNPTLPKPPVRPRFLYMLSTFFKVARKRPYVFISDGGHVENLGLVQLLIRRCQIVVAVDSGHDPQHEFTDVANALRIARVYHGIRIVQLTEQTDAPVQEWDLEGIRFQRAEKSEASLLASALQMAGYPGTLLQTASHFSAARILYPGQNEDDPKDGLLILVKPSITGDESMDILQYRSSSPAFPQEPTSELVFSPAQVESYRALGYHIGEQLCRFFPPSGGGGGPEGTFVAQSCDSSSLIALRQEFEANYLQWTARGVSSGARQQDEVKYNVGKAK
ncbi:MAG: hypothetical protein ACKO3T_05360 [Planctomycetaceae bacterium]